MENVLHEFKDHIAAAGARPARRLRIVGGGSKDFYGNALQRLTCLIRAPIPAWSAYEPTELVITARCGTPLAEIESALAEQTRCSRSSRRISAGRRWAAGRRGLSGPRRAAAGALRDFVLGAHDGWPGRDLHFGGQVMKNVAGYDVSRLFAGSMGILGLLLEVSLKVLPRPTAETTLRFAIVAGGSLAALERLGRTAIADIG